VSIRGNRMSKRLVSSSGLILILNMIVATLMGCESSDAPEPAHPAVAQDLVSKSEGRIAGLLDSLYEHVLDQPQDINGYLRLARLLSILRRFDDADRILRAADSAGLAAHALVDLRISNLLAWAGHAREEYDSMVFARCLQRLMQKPLPDSLLPVVSRLVGIGHPIRQVTNNVTADYAPKYFPHGQSLVFFSRLEREAEEYGGHYSVRYQTQICTVGIEGGEPAIISDGKASEFFPDISGDGRWVVCQRSDGDTLKAEWTAAGGSYLYLYDLQLGEGHRLGGDDLYGRCPRFMPSDNEVIFATSSAGDQGWLSSIDPATEEITPRFRHSALFGFDIPRLAFFPSVFPDGRMVYQAGLWQNKAIFISDEYGRDITRVTSHGSERQPSVAPDGRAIVMVTDYREGTELYTYTIADSTRQQITFDGLTKSFPSYSPDGRYIAYSAKRPEQPDADYEIYILDLAISAGRAEIEARVQMLAREQGLIP